MEGPADFARRALGAASRRAGRPELLAAFYPQAAQMLREEVAIAAVLAAVLRERRDVSSTSAPTAVRSCARPCAWRRTAATSRSSRFPRLAAELTRPFPGVDCRQLALGASPDVAEFCHFRTLDGWSGLRRSPQISDERGRPRYIQVQVSTLDAELGELAPSVDQDRRRGR